LSFNAVANKSLYYPVEAGNVSTFGQAIDTMGASLVNQSK
jgi:hypothetical protein